MAKTITLEDVQIQSIVLNDMSFSESKGISSSINYAVQDSEGNNAQFKNSIKYTTDTNYDEDIMSETAETHLKAYIAEMKKLMVEREEL
tara:strand:- start:17 stop:283 length:267 start_codon:yes stop_codon:yes gene_type:complete